MSLYTNVALKETIDIALRKLHEQEKSPSIARKTMKRLLNMAVSQVHFECNEIWFVHKDGLAMGASFAVDLAYIWLKQYAIALSRDIPEMLLPEKILTAYDMSAIRRSRKIQKVCECCLNWYHVKCGDISDDEYRTIIETVWCCRKCIAIRKKNKSVLQATFLHRYIDDILRTLKGDPEVLRTANLLHQNLQFTIETTNTNGKLELLDLQISIDKNRKINCG